MIAADLDRARRVVASPLWRWLPGMLVLDREKRLRMLTVYGPSPLPSTAYRWWGTVMHVNDPDDSGCADGWCDAAPHDTLPDLTDPATLGCILALYLDARPTLAAPDPVLTLAAVYGLRDPRTVEALVAALEVGS